MRAIVLSLAVAILTVLSGIGWAVDAPDGFELVSVPAIIKQVTIPTGPTECFAESVIEFSDLGGRVAYYQIRYTHVATGSVGGGNRMPPFDKVTVGAGGVTGTKEAPPGSFWVGLSGNFGFNCADAAAAAADDWTNPQILAVVMLPPTALFTYRGTGVPGEFFFDASLSRFEAALTKYEWDFGDGQTGTGKTISHPFAAEGEHVVTLKVTDRLNGTATFSMKMVPRLVITQVLTQPTSPAPPNPFALRVQLRSDSGVTIHAVTPSAELSPDTVVVAGAGPSNPASADMPPGSTQWFDLPVVAVGEGQGLAVVDAAGTVGEKVIGAIHTASRRFPVGGGISATLDAPSSVDQGEAFEVVLHVMNQTGHVLDVTPGALTASVPGAATISPPEPAGTVQVANGGLINFTYVVTPHLAGQLSLSATASAHDLTTSVDTPLARTQTVSVAGAVSLELTPTFAHTGIGQPGTVEVVVANSSGETLKDVAIAFQITPASGDGAAEVTQAGDVPATIPGTSASVVWNVRLTHPGSVEITATLTATGAATGTPVGAIASGTVEISAPTIGIAGPLGGPLPLGDAKANADLNVVVTNFVPATPVAIRWAGTELAKLVPGDDGRATGTVQVGHFPVRDSCSGLMQGRQGDFVVDTLVQAVWFEHMAAADGLTFSDDTTVVKGPRCNGEIIVFPTDTDYLFVGQPTAGGRSAEREELADDGKHRVTAYLAAWVQAPGLLLPGVVTPRLRIERPRLGNGSRVVDEFAFPYAATPEFFAAHDPIGKSGVTAITTSCQKSSDVVSLSGYSRSAHAVRFFLARTNVSGVFFAEHDVQFVGDATEAPSLTTQGSTLFVQGIMGLWGNARLGLSDVGGQGANTSAYAAGIDVFRRSPRAECTTKKAPAGTNEVGVESNDGFAIGDSVAVNPGQPNQDDAAIIGFGSLILDRPLAFDHVEGEAVVNTGTADEPPSCDLLRGAAGIACWCREGLHPTSCAGIALPKNIAGKFARGCALSQQAAATTSRKATKLARKASASFRKAAKLAQKAGKKKLDATCAAAIASSVTPTP
ncbi:MAG TPA: PKD domain-containing protein [Candidatus Binatia bacterium]|jgi:PKD repeat protein|nr:PKD domain-containing protein [Candidatus Binatia bacterium]